MKRLKSEVTPSSERDIQFTSTLLQSLSRDELIEIIQENLPFNHLLCDSVINATQKKIQSRQIYIRNLPYEGTEEELKTILQPYGEIISCTIIRDNKTKVSKGYGFAVFKDADSAWESCKSSVEWCGRILNISLSNKVDQSSLSSPTISEIDENHRKLFIQNISYSTDESTLYSFFSTYGTILDLCICRNSDKSSKGYGFITFSTIEATKACLNDHSNRLIDKHLLKVSLASSNSSHSSIMYSIGSIQSI